MTPSKCTTWLAAGMLAIAALPVAAQMSTEDAMRQAQQYMKNGGQMPSLPDVVALQERDVTALLDVLPKLRDLGLSSDMLDTTDPAGMARGMELGQQAMNVLGEHGFTAQGFQEVVYSVGLAIAGLEARGREGELAAAARQGEQALAQMEGQMSPEQMAMMRQQLGNAMGAMRQVEQQPPGNLALVEKYRAPLEALLNAF